MFSVVFN